MHAGPATLLLRSAVGRLKWGLRELKEAAGRGRSWRVVKAWYAALRSIAARSAMAAVWTRTAASGSQPSGPALSYDEHAAGMSPLRR